jgi:hypothetical protein
VYFRILQSRRCLERCLDFDRWNGGIGWRAKYRRFVSERWRVASG